MYHPASIAQLSQSQISKALNGHPVRVSAGSHHEIHVSPEQLKKIAKAHIKGKASTITLDPYQIQNHMHILGSGVGRVNKYNKWVDALGARQVIDAGMSKGASTIGGLGLKKRGRPRKHGGALMAAGY